jgi:O-6-methylguanine DNA methyltransferase
MVSSVRKSANRQKKHAWVQPERQGFVSFSHNGQVFPSATMRKIDSKEDIITTPPQRILLAGTQFRIDVWRALLTIERGKTTTYSALATIAGHPTAVRAVATSVGRNPISVIVPCHRIVPASGGVGNYHSGAEIKRRLLEWEAR